MGFHHSDELTSDQLNELISRSHAFQKEINEKYANNAEIIGLNKDLTSRMNETLQGLEQTQTLTTTSETNDNSISNREKRGKNNGKNIINKLYREFSGNPNTFKKKIQEMIKKTNDQAKNKPKLNNYFQARLIGMKEQYKTIVKKNNLEDKSTEIFG